MAVMHSVWLTPLSFVCFSHSANVRFPRPGRYCAYLSSVPPMRSSPGDMARAACRSRAELKSRSNTLAPFHGALSCQALSCCQKSSVTERYCSKATCPRPSSVAAATVASAAGATASRFVAAASSRRRRSWLS